MTPMMFIHFNFRIAATPHFVTCSLVVLVYYDYRTVEDVIRLYDIFRFYKRKLGRQQKFKVLNSRKKIRWIYIYLFFLFFFWCCGPKQVMASSFMRCLDHTRRTTLGRTPRTSDELVAETSTWQNMTLTRDRYPCPQRNSNPQSQQSSCRRPTP
jgi:hypothetical protein